MAWIVGVPLGSRGIERLGIPCVERPIVAEPLDQVGVRDERLADGDQVGATRIDGGLAVVPEIAAGEDQGATIGPAEPLEEVSGDRYVVNPLGLVADMHVGEIAP